MDETFASAALALGALALLPAAKRRFELSRAKHRSLAGHSRWAKRLAALIPGYAYDEARFFASDGAPEAVAQQRRIAFDRLSAVFEQRYPVSAAITARAREAISDLQFTGRYRVPFQYAPLVRQRLRVGAFAQAADGVMVEDLDGNRFFDLTGSYGVNVFGTDFYKACIDEGAVRARALGPVLGNLHLMTLANAERLKEISGLDEVSFHMSGTEAVMQAVRLARYHTRRKYLVRFCGSYHGWWEDVQPGPGNPLPPRETYTLRDMDERSLKVLRTRRDVACVLVNPLQALHPNANAPGDGQLIDGSRRAGFDRQAYADWLKRLREVCTARGIVLIFDEVFVGFREERPADICFARGTFNSHPYVMGAMAAFLDRLQTPEVKTLYDGLDARWNARTEHLNSRLREAGVPVQVANLSSIWTVLYTQPGRYHWMLQFYLRAQGLALSWVGTGRLIFSLNYGDAQFEAVADRFVEACVQMQADGWWWSEAALTAKAIKRSILGEMLRLKF